jgi:hypothetical protein
LSADDYLRLDQKIEAQDLQHLKYGTANAESITVSFWVRSAKTGTYTVELQHGENPSTFRYAGLQYTINSANTWEKKALTFSGQTANAINNDSGNGLEIHWYLAVGSAYTSGGYTAGTFRESNGTSTRCSGQTANLADSTSNDWHITGVQLELGSTATDFEHRSYGEELALCQRYYHATQSAFISHAANGFVFNLQFPVAMRATPSQTHSYSGVANDVYKISDAATPTFVPNGIFMDVNALKHGYDHDGGFTAGAGYVTDWIFDSEI